MDEYPIGTVLANPNNANPDIPYHEYAHRMEFEGDRKWFVVNTKHGGAYTDGIELSSWRPMIEEE